MRNRSMALVVRDDRILMIQTFRFNRYIWELPGGGIEPGETPEEAAIRELKEESGLRGVISRPLNTIHCKNGSIEYVFLVDVSEEQEAIVGKDPEIPEGGEQAIKRVGWKKLDELSEKDRAFLWSYGLLNVGNYYELAVGWGDEISYPGKHLQEERTLLYRLPVLEDRDALSEYVKEHRDNGEMGISASFGLQGMEFAEWVQMIQGRAKEGVDDWGQFLTLLCIEGEKIIGLLNIRYDQTIELSEKNGDIGYGVRPSERGKGYATQMLRHGLEICKEHGMSKVRLGCYKDNVASAKVIYKCGGVLEEEADRYSEGVLSQYYSITL